MDLYFSSDCWIKHIKETREIFPPCCASPAPAGGSPAVPGGFLHPALPEQQAPPGEVLLCSSGVTEGKGEVMVVCANSKILLRSGVALFLWHCCGFSSETCLVGTGHREVCSSIGVGILGVCLCLGVGGLSW